MHIDKFSNYLLALLLTLQIVGYVLLFSMWSHFGTRGLFFSTIIYFMICTLCIFYIQRINVYDDRGNKQKLSDVFGGVFAIVMWLIVTSVITVVVAMMLGYYLATKYNREHLAGILIPLITLGVLYGSLAFVSTST